MRRRSQATMDTLSRRSSPRTPKPYLQSEYPCQTRFCSVFFLKTVNSKATGRISLIDSDDIALASALCALALFCPLLYSQSPTGEIRQAVQDPIRRRDAGIRNILDNQPFQTDPQGQYAFQNLPYGRYRLEVNKAGFTTQSATIDVRSETRSSVPSRWPWLPRLRKWM